MSDFPKHPLSGYRFVVAVACLLMLSLSAQAARQPQADALHEQVENILESLDVIRFVMGTPRSALPMPVIENAQMHEVFFQAQLLQRRTAQLGFEVFLRRSPPVPVPAGRISNDHVRGALDDTAGILVHVQRRLARQGEAIDQGVKAARRFEVDGDSLYGQILRATRNVELMLRARTEPEDVYRDTRVAVNYAAALLEHFAEASLPENSLPRASGMTPREVFALQRDCFELLRSITGRSELQMMTFGWPGAVPLDLPPSEVSIMATLNLAELAGLHQRFDLPLVTVAEVYTGRKFPTDVHQQAATLKWQLQRLDQLLGDRALVAR